MRKIDGLRTLVLLAGAGLAACATQPEAEPAIAGVTAPGEAPSAEPPGIRWQVTGEGGYIYHHVGGDCAFLTHGNGRNNAWGLWRLPLTEVTRGEVASDGYKGVEIHYACKDGSDCIQSGKLEETPGRVADHKIPFDTAERAETWLSDVDALAKACAAPG